VVKRHAEGGEGQANFELSHQMALRQYLFSFVHNPGCRKQVVYVCTLDQPSQSVYYRRLDLSWFRTCPTWCLPGCRSQISTPPVHGRHV